jgi:hypothetical protein
VLLVLPGGLGSLWVRIRDAVVRRLVPVDESSLTGAPETAAAAAAAEVPGETEVPPPTDEASPTDEPAGAAEGGRAVTT